MSNFITQKSKELLETLITSQTRIKLLLKFFLNSNSSSYLRHLETEFGESSNAIRVELNRFEKAGLLKSFIRGNRKYFQANQDHPLFRDIHNIILKYVGIDRVIDNVVQNLGDIRKVFLTGEFAEGRDNNIIDFIFVGEDINKGYLLDVVEKAEKLIHRKVRYLVMNSPEFDDFKMIYSNGSIFLLWEKEVRSLT
jgi:hypothetical protein